MRPPRLPYSPPAFVRLRKGAENSLMHPFQWCNGESRSETPRGRQVSDRTEGSCPSLSQVSREMGPARRRPGARLCSILRGIGGGAGKSRFQSRARKGLRTRGGLGAGEPTGSRPLCSGLTLLPPSPAFVRSNSRLCCGCWMRSKSALGLGSPRGSSSSRPKLCRLF